jgi:hypothetical protein
MQDAFVYAPVVSDVEVATAVLDVLIETVLGGRSTALADYLRTRETARQKQ